MDRFVHNHLLTIIAECNKHKHDLDRVSGSLCQLNPNHLLQKHFLNPTLNVLMPGAWAWEENKGMQGICINANVKKSRQSKEFL